MAEMGPGLRGCNPIPKWALLLLNPSFPRKREPRDFSHLLLGPRFRGDDELARPDNFLTLMTQPARRFAETARSQKALEIRYLRKRWLSAFSHGWPDVTRHQASKLRPSAALRILLCCRLSTSKDGD